MKRVTENGAKKQKNEIGEIHSALHLGRLVFLLAAVGSVDPAPAALEEAIFRIRIDQRPLDSNKTLAISSENEKLGIREVTIVFGCFPFRSLTLL